MYSLYRAWLSLGPCIPPPPPPPSASSAPLNLSTTNVGGGGSPITPSTPDVALNVGPTMTQFSAHATVLSAHSGFFKAALINHNASGPSSSTAPMSINVPNVNVDEFSSLLTFMYTGYLDLNIANIYNILLATHILHMPRALELCRTFLLNQTQSITFNNNELIATKTNTNNNIIKPIASRTYLLPNQQQQFIGGYSTPTFAPTTTTTCLIQKSDTTSSPFKSVKQNNEPSTSMIISDEQHTSTKPTTSKNQPLQILTTSINNIPDNTTKKSNKNKKRSAELTTISTNKDNINNSKVIIDIACCDGPVRFHRVINDSYGLIKQQQQQQTTLSTTSSSTTDNINYEIDETNRNAAMNKVMNARIINCNDDDNFQQQSNNNNENNNMFTCLYCNHTFKSQYCYQKHARRHLNPVSIEAKAVGNNNDPLLTTTTTNNKIVIPQQQQQREVKLLDMNVQYYPCKSCGAKFPSYYFVHKHRKLCHAEEMADNTNKNNEIIAECTTNNNNNNGTNNNSIINNNNDDTTNSSCIDVVDVVVNNTRIDIN